MFIKVIEHKTKTYISIDRIKQVLMIFSICVMHFVVEISAAIKQKEAPTPQELSTTHKPENGAVSHFSSILKEPL